MLTWNYDDRVWQHVRVNGILGEVKHRSRREAASYRTYDKASFSKSIRDREYTSSNIGFEDVHDGSLLAEAEIGPVDCGQRRFW
jgi:hypothetical protein